MEKKHKRTLYTEERLTVVVVVVVHVDVARLAERKGRVEQVSAVGHAAGRLEPMHLELLVIRGADALNKFGDFVLFVLLFLYCQNDV